MILFVISIVSIIFYSLSIFKIYVRIQNCFSYDLIGQSTKRSFNVRLTINSIIALYSTNITLDIYIVTKIEYIRSYLEEYPSFVFLKI
jgi:hypothetical protein